MIKLGDYMNNNKFEKYDSKKLEDIVDEFWITIKKIPNNKVTKNMCKSAIRQSVDALDYIPERYLTEEIYIYALEQDYHALRYIPKNKLTKKYCNLAFSKSAYAIKYFSERFKTNDICRDAININWQLFQFCSDSFFNSENAERILKDIIKLEDINNLDRNKQKSLFNIFNRLKQKNLYIKINEKIIDNLKNYNIIEKRYDKEKNKFIIVKDLFEQGKSEIITFKTFDKFYKYLNGNLLNAEVYDYDFNGIDLKKYNIENVNINSEILVKQGLYDDTYYKENIKKYINTTALVPVKNEEEKSIAVLHDDDFSFGLLREVDVCRFRTIYYISDIHLDYKIAKRFKEYATQFEIKMYIKKFVKRMLFFVRDYYHFLIIAGDVSNSYEISEMFYTELVNQSKFKPEEIIVVLGNHELWNLDGKVNSNIKSMIGLYNKLFQDLGITFLQNDLLLIKQQNNMYRLKPEIISGEQLMKMTDEKIREITLDSKITILGGIGFSGYNPEFNANKLIYAYTIPTFDEDKQLTDVFFDMYKKLKRAIPDKNIIVLTHTPKQDWSNDIYNPKWIYINGHTHKNTYFKDNNRTVYADNQLGYYNEDVCLKRIDFSTRCNIFQYYKDGVYEIDTEKYKEFYFQLGYRMQCNIEDGIILLLKKQDNYLFLYKNKKDILYILNGGMRNKLDNQDIKYYYDNLKKYADLVKINFSSYYNYIKNVSEYVKAFGGSGIIHGAIVDIDFFNHLYVNVYDGKVTPYFALSIVDKVVYKDLRNLLEEKCSYLLESYDNIAENPKKDLIPVRNDLIKSKKTYYDDTGIYRESRILKNVQYLIDENIIRIWKDEILDGKRIDTLVIGSGK